MELRLSDDQELLRSTARDFLSQRVPHARVDELERSGRFDDELWSELAELGWLGLAVAEAHGGSGGTLADLELLCEELGRAACPVPFLPIAVAAVACLEAVGGEPATRLLKEVSAGAARPVVAATGASGRVELDPDAAFEAGRLTGLKLYVEGAPHADRFLVPAVDAAGEAVVALVEAGPGVEVSPQRGMAGAHAGGVEFAGAPAEPLGPAAGILPAVLSRVAAMQAAWCAGGAARLLEDTVAYASERVQFGVPIGSFQAVQHQLADCAIAVAEAETLARQAADALDSGARSGRRLASTAFVRAADTFVFVARRCHQTWGGMGYSTEAHVHLYSRRAKAAQQAWGGVDQHLDVVAEELRRTELLRDRYPQLTGGRERA